MSHKNSPTDWLLKLIALLKESPDGMTLKELAGHFGVDEKTIRRSLTQLDKMGVKVGESTGAHGRKYWSIAE